MVREVHDGHDKCESITFIKLKLTDDLPEQVSSKMDFQNRIFHWKTVVKVLVNVSDRPGHNVQVTETKESVLLWCDGMSPETIPGGESAESHKRKSTSPPALPMAPLLCRN